MLEIEAGISTSSGDDQENELCREILKIELGVNENTNEKDGRQEQERSPSLWHC